MSPAPRAPGPPGAPRFDPVPADGAQPPYLLAKQSLAHAIATGALAPGQRLPSERYLCEQLAVSRVTLRRTLTALKEEGLVDSSPRRGWRVADVGFTHAADASALAGFADVNRRLGRAVTARVLLARTRKARSEEAERLQLPTGTAVFELHRLRSLDGLPVCVSHDLVPAAVAPALADADFTSASLFALLVAAGHAPATAQYTARAALATAQERRHLDLSAPAPVLHTTRLSHDADGAPCADSRETYRADRYELRVTLGRGK
ncbi:GntR family transcriptional regulator [Streptomyces sp. NPDC059009]|uniref:GntR family transcriptional regulator n=1 Tax=Streptomyces sp. NPDC059009 TaxID=3346694 RepID=UPI0036CBAF78